MDNISITTPGENNVTEHKEPISLEVEAGIIEKLRRAIGSNEPRSPEEIASTNKRFLGSLTPDERTSFEQAIYSNTPEVSTVGTKDRKLTEGLNAAIQQRGMLSPGCTGDRDITVHPDFDSKNLQLPDIIAQVCPTS